MKLKRQIILYLCIILLALLSMTSLVLRFSAPNPTHRWYSSQMPEEIALQSNVINWRAAEMILAGDLGLPDNNLSDNLRCFCSPHHATPPDRCNSCTPVIGLSTYRIPDVVSDTLIADSKFYQNSTLRVDEQLRDFRLIAEATNRSLWVFVPIFEIGQEPYTQEVLELVQSTNGDIIPYFVVGGYENRLMFEAFVNGLLVFVVVITVGLVIWAYILKNRPQNPGDTVDSREEIHKAEDSVQETEEFMKRMERLSKRSKDEDDKKGKL